MREYREVYGGTASRALARACRATASADLVMGRVVVITHWMASSD